MLKRDIPTYAVWRAMKQRCINSNNKGFNNYGGRGITYDPKWESFEGFVEDMGFRPEITEGELSLERKDNNGPYCKDNCIWASRVQQNYNQRLRKDNNSGIRGVRYCAKREKYEATGVLAGKKEYLYRGIDFFEACCARKSWEAKHFLTL